jgi:DNA-binding PadR family transcriptional regulator
MQEIVESIVQELRRGTVVIAVMSQLKTDQYGYSLLTKLNEAGFPIDQGTMYPLLRRLESQKILTSSWDVREARPKKYYSLTDFGKDVYEELIREYSKLTESIVQLTEEKK